MIVQIANVAIALISLPIFLRGWGRGLSFEERAVIFPGAFAVSITLVSSTLSIFDVPFNISFFLASLAFLSAMLAGVFARFPQKRPKSTPSPLQSAVIFSLSLIAFLILFAKFNFAPIGTDSTRFAYLAEIFGQEDAFLTDLSPYEDVSSFFYFPFPMVFPAYLRHLGIPPLDGISLASILLGALSSVAFLMFAREIFPNDGKASFLSAGAYVLFFNIPLTYFAGRGVLAYSISWFFFLLGAVSIARLARGAAGNRAGRDFRDLLFLIVGIAGMLLSHWYLLAGFSILSLSFLAFSGGSSSWKPVALAYSISFALAAPFFSVLLLSSGNPVPVERVSEWKYGEYYFEQSGLSERVARGTVSDPEIGAISGGYSVAYVLALALVLAYIPSGRLPKGLVFFLFIAIFLSILLSSSITHRRTVDYLRLTYPLGMGLAFSAILGRKGQIPKAVALGAVAILSMSAFSTPWILAKIPEIDPMNFDPVAPGEKAAFSFIREKTPRSAVFLIDGPGMGCVGGQAGSHGERIFPETGRRVFLFTNYCWANYDKEEFFRKIDIYRRISINPDDPAARSELISSGVTHLYLGPSSLGLDRSLLSGSANYKKIFSSGGAEIFEIL